MSVINPDEWRSVACVAVTDKWASTYQERDIRATAAVLCLLDLARYGTVQWFPDTDPVDVPWAPEPEPEWVRCVDASHHAPGKLTASKTYRVVNVDGPYVAITNDAGGLEWFRSKRFVPVSADEATVTIDVPVAWARYMAANEKCSPAEFLAAVDACREALSKAGLL